MNIDILAEYVELCHLMSFEKAAKKRHVTESCLSRHMTDLEKEVGAKLFVQRRKLSLTPAGKRLLADGVKILMLHDKCIEECRRLDKANAREILVYHHPVRFEEMRLLSQGIQRFKAENPDGMPSLVSFDGKSEVDIVAAGKADLAIMLHYPEGPDLEAVITEADARDVAVEPFCSVPLKVVLRRDHPLAGKGHVDIRELAQQVFAVPASRTMDFYRRALLALVKNIGFDIEYMPHTADSLVELALLAAEDEAFLGTPVMVEEIASTFPGDYATLDIEDDRFSLTLFLVYNLETGSVEQIEKLADSVKLAASGK